MPRYSASGADTNSVNTTIFGITGSASVQPALYDILIGPSSAPTDTYAVYNLRRYTAAGTSTAVTPLALRPPAPAATSAVGYAHSAEPTYTAGADLLVIPLYSRATYRWQTDPEYGIFPTASANNGIGVLVTAVGTTQSITVTVHFQE